MNRRQNWAQATDETFSRLVAQQLGTCGFNRAVSVSFREKKHRIFKISAG